MLFPHIQVWETERLKMGNNRTLFNNDVMIRRNHNVIMEAYSLHNRDT